MALISEDIESQITVKENLMTTDIPSIWVELNVEYSVPVLICGVYREWSHNGDTTEASQVTQIEKFTTQIDEANVSYEKIIITGDINLCSTKWAETSYIRKNISRPLLECLNQYGMSVEDIGTTYLRIKLQLRPIRERHENRLYIDNDFD